MNLATHYKWNQITGVSVCRSNCHDLTSYCHSVVGLSLATGGSLARITKTPTKISGTLSVIGLELTVELTADINKDLHSVMVTSLSTLLACVLPSSNTPPGEVALRAYLARYLSVELLRFNDIKEVNFERKVK